MYAFKEKESTNNIDLLSQTLELVDKTTLELEKYLESYQADMSKVNDDKERRNSYKHDAFKQIIAIVATLGLIASLPVGAHKLAKKLGEGKEKVTIDVTTYEKGENPQVGQTKKYLSDNPEDKVYIVETIPNDDFNYDLVLTYDATNEETTKVEDYYNLDLSSLPLIEQTNVTSKRENKASKKIVIEKVNEDDVTNDIKFTVLFGFYLVYIVGTLGLECVYYDFYEYTFILHKVEELIDDIKTINSSKNVKELEKKANKIKEIVLKILSSDKRLLDKFEKEFENNKDLLSDPTELLSKYCELKSKIAEAEYKLKISK